MIICDTGPLVALADSSDVHHEACTEFFDASTEAVVVPAPVVVEVCWLIGRRLGPAAEAAFLASLAAGDPTIEECTPVDYQRASELVERYTDMDLGFVDAAVIAMAERLKITTVATINPRDFRVVRPAHCDAFTLVP